MDRRFRSLFIQTALVLVFAFTLGSCMNDPAPPDEPGDGIPVVISLNPLASDTPGSPATRAGYHDPNELDPIQSGFAPGRDPEDINISHLRVLFYKTSNGELAHETETDVNSDDPIDITVLTGTYDVVFIANTDHNGMNTSGDRVLNNFFASRTNYDLLGKLDNARLDAAAFSSDEDIPMLGIVREVRIKGYRSLELKDENDSYVPTPATPADPWNPTLTRIGIRVSISITMSQGQFADWTVSSNTDAKKIKISNLPTDSYLREGGLNGESTSGRGSRTYTAVQTTLGSGNTPVIPTNAEGYYWVDSSGDEPVGRVRFDRIILPEVMFATVNSASKAIELSINLGGSGGDLKAKLAQGAEPEASVHGYILPRNLWLHVDATVAENKLRVKPDPHPWDTAITEGGIIGKNVWLKAGSNPVRISGFNRATFTATTNNPTGTITAATTAATVSWVTSVGVIDVATNDGVTKGTVVVNTTTNDTGAERSTVIVVKSGGLELPVTVIQAMPTSYAAPGVIGYIADGPRKGELTILGSKEYAGTPLVGLDSRALATGRPLETETVHAALFKWGSLVALSSDYNDSSTASNWFDANDIIAAPTEIGGAATLRSLLGGQANQPAWITIPYRNSTTNTAFHTQRGWESDPANGLGDPCQYYFGGDWFLPSGGADGWYSEGGAPFGNTGHTNFSSWPAGSGWKQSGDNALPISGALGQKNNNADWNMYLPAIGVREAVNGHFYSANAEAVYWDTDPAQTNMQARNNGALQPNRTGNYAWAFPVRCVETPGVRVPRGVIGYIHNPGGPRHRELTLGGDKSFYLTGEADQNTYTVYAAHFKFGSLVATDSSDNGPFSPSDVVAVPRTFMNSPSQAAALENLRTMIRNQSTPVGKWSVIEPMTADVPSEIDPIQLYRAKGDPCAYWFDHVMQYGDGGWRLPTEAENIQFVGDQNALSAPANIGYHIYPGGSYYLYNDGIGTLPAGTAQGARLPAGGGIRDIAINGSFGWFDETSYWSSSFIDPTNNGAFKLKLSATVATLHNVASVQNGNAVRCVQPSRPPSEVRVGNVIWAGSNLIADQTFAKEAADPGGYFQWGLNTVYPGYGNPMIPSSQDYINIGWGGNNPSGVWPSDRNPCPDPWRIPTREEYEALYTRVINHGGGPQDFSKTIPFAFPGMTAPGEMPVLEFVGDNSDILIFPNHPYRTPNGDILPENLFYDPLTPYNTYVSFTYWANSSTGHHYGGPYMTMMPVNVFDTTGYEGMGVRCVRDATP